LLAREDDFCVVGECTNGTDAVRRIREDPPDIVFLDVQMPELDGFGVIESVGVDKMPVTIFVTAYDEYAVEAFDANALDYLLKPFDKARFARAVTRAREHVRVRTTVRIHRSSIVNLEQIREMRPAFHGDYTIVLRNGTQLTASRTYRNRLQALEDQPE
jgi:DNA-binding LytR/AlgR family response regulator